MIPNEEEGAISRRRNKLMCLRSIDTDDFVKLSLRDIASQIDQVLRSSLRNYVI